jgi:DNA primase
MLKPSRTFDAAFPRLEAFQASPWNTTATVYAEHLQSLKEVARLAVFLEERLGLSLEQAHALGVGFADRNLGEELPSNRIKAGREIRTRLMELGIYKENGREALRGCVTIPLVDETGAITGIEGYRVDPKSKKEPAIVLGSGKSKITDREVKPPQAETQKPVQEITAPVVQEIATPTVTAPALTPLDIVVEASAVVITRGDRRYRIRGLERNMSSLSLKVNITASREELIHVDTVDLYKAPSRASFQRVTALELYCDEETVKRDIGFVLSHIEELRNRQIEAAKGITKPVELTPEEHREAMLLLQDPDLIARIIRDLDQCGMVGEPFNKLAAYLAVTSRLLTRPLAILVRSNSAAGKTTLMESILSLVPPEQQLRLSNLTAQSLYYLPAGAVKHKTLAISEDQGITEAAYALKLLQSEGKLTHATVGKNSQGNFQMQSHEVEGPVQLFLTSTRMVLDEELVNRCFVLTVDESAEHTRAIQERQRILETRSGKAALAEIERLRALHRNAQRLIRTMEVDNPLVEGLQFPFSRTRNRRDHEKFLTLIRTIALLHQHQRTIHVDDNGVERIEVIPSDIDLANRLVDRILKLSMDELTPQTQSCLTQLKQFVEQRAKMLGVSRNEVRFTRRMFRESIQWTDYQVSTHLERLVSLEYVRPHRGRQGATYVYELLD